MPEEETTTTNYEGEGSDANLVRLHHAALFHLRLPSSEVSLASASPCSMSNA